MPPPPRPQSAPAAPPAAAALRAPPFSFRGVAESPSALRPSAPLREGQIDAAWATLTGGRADAHLSPKALLERLRLFQPSATAEDAALLLGGQPFLTREALAMLLVGNHSLFLLFDPLAEAVGAGALGAPGELTYGKLRRACEGLPAAAAAAATAGSGGGGAGGALTEAAWQVLLQEGDADGDGRLQLEDLRALLQRHGGE